jgi:5-methylcytosine-specific restriction enzyme subunit McrC
LFDDVDPLEPLKASDIEQAHRSLTRLTAANEPALTIIGLLKAMHGLSFQPSGKSIRTSGFLFDMNYFFQRLLLRFLSENLTAGSIKGQHAIRNVFAYLPEANPRRQTAPTPRPDYALFSDGKVIGFLDAKYRDVWEKGFSSNWLYQLSIYALASPSCISVMLYATTSPTAREERIQIHQPVPWSSQDTAIVIIRPVLLQKLAELVHPSQSRYFAAERRQFANNLVSLGLRAPTVIAAQELGQAA